VSDARLRRDIAWNLVPVALLAIVGLGLNFLIGAWWGASALGVFNQVTTAFFVFSVIAAGGLQYSVLRAIAEAPEDRTRVAAVAVGALVPTLVLAVTTSFVFVAARGWIAAWLDSDAVGIGMLWAGPGLVVFALNKVLLGVVNGLRRMRAYAVYTSLRYLLIATGLLLARRFDMEPAWLAGIWTFAEAVLFLVLVVEFFATVTLRRARGWLAWSRAHIRYGSRGVLATLGYEINSKLDVWMIGIALSDRLVGIYSLASALWEGALQLAVVVQNNLNPMIARDLAAGRTRDVEALARRARRWFVPAFVVICGVSVVAYPYVVPWLIGSAEFAEGAVPFAILMAGAALAASYLPFHTVLMMAGMPGAQTVFVVIVLAINCMLNLALVPPFGLSGAAIAAAAALAASALLLRYMVRLRVGARI
jgi:O-antigen/teichoic acid export membrane protein